MSERERERERSITNICWQTHTCEMIMPLKWNRYAFDACQTNEAMYI